MAVHKFRKIKKGYLDSEVCFEEQYPTSAPPHELFVSVKRLLEVEMNELYKKRTAESSFPPRTMILSSTGSIQDVSKVIGTSPRHLRSLSSPPSCGFSSNRVLQISPTISQTPSIQKGGAFESMQFLYCCNGVTVFPRDCALWR